jgi:hypothetical protein
MYHRSLVCLQCAEQAVAQNKGNIQAQRRKARREKEKRRIF